MMDAQQQQQQQQQHHVPGEAVTKSNTNNLHSFVDETMRDLDSLLRPEEEVASSSALLSQKDSQRRLDFYEKISQLEQEKEQQRIFNLRLEATQEGLILQVQKQKKVQAEFEIREAKLKHQIETQKSSMSSLFADLETARRRVEWLEAKLSNVDPGAGDPTAATTCTTTKKREQDQAEFLLRAAAAHNNTSSTSGTSSPGNMEDASSSPSSAADQQRIRVLEEENARLKSDFVRLQAEYREERYLSRKTIEELMEENMTASTAPTESTSTSSSSRGSSSNSSGRSSSPDDSLSSNEDRPLRTSNSTTTTTTSTLTRPSLARAPSPPRKLKEFGQRRQQLPAAIISSGNTPMKPLTRKTSLPAATRVSSSSGRSMIDTDDCDRPTMRPMMGNGSGGGRIGAPRRTRSLWPAAATPEGGRLAPPPPPPPPEDDDMPMIRMPRRVQSLQPYHHHPKLNQPHQKEQEINLHDIGDADDAASRSGGGGLLSRGLSLRRKNWWGGKGQ